MPRSQRHLIIGGLVLLDLVAIAIAVTAAYRFGGVYTIGSDYSGTRRLLSLIAIPVGIGLFALNRLYVVDELLEGPVEYGRVMYACTLMALSLSVLGFWGKNLGETAPSRTLVALAWLFSLVAVGSARFMARRIIRALRRRGYLVSQALIMGLGAPGISLANHFQVTKHVGVKVVGFIDDFLAPGTQVADGLKVLGPPSAMSRILKQTGATEIIVVPTAMAWESFQDLIRSTTTLNGHTIRLTSGFGDILSTSVRVNQFGGVPLLTIERVRITGLDAFLKRLLDYGMAVALLPVALPLVALFAAVLSVTGVRPFRKVEVVGRGGTAFDTYRLNTKEPGNAVQRFVGCLGMDKLTQTVNLLWGQMSVVGPRPISLDQQTDYGRWMPNLLTVKPGIIGPWRVRRPKSLDDEMQMNLFYIRNYTIWLDLEIVVRSILGLFAGRSAAPQEEEVQDVSVSQHIARPDERLRDKEGVV